MVVWLFYFYKGEEIHMVIKVYSKPGCGICEAAKKKDQNDGI